MKQFAIVSGICASFLLGTAITALGQDQDEHRNDKQENARPANRQEQARPQEQNRPEDRRNQEPQNRENERQMQDRQQQQRQNENKQQQGRQQPQQPRQGGNEPSREVNGGRQDQARPEGQARGGERRGGNQRRIPDSDFHAHFGREHHFTPGRMQVYNGQPQFYYGGYTFALIQAWPDDWGYDADDYYIDEFEGEYWLFNLGHPGVRLELIIVE